MRWAEMATPWPSPHIQAWAGAAPGAGVLGLKRGPPRRRCGSPALPVARPLAKGDLAHAPRPGPRLSSRVPVSAPGPSPCSQSGGRCPTSGFPPARRALPGPPRALIRRSGLDTQTLPLKEETLRHATSATPRMPSRTCHYLKSSCSFLSAPRGGGGAGRYRSLASNAAPPVPRTRQGAWRCPVTLCRMHERIVGRLETFGR